MRKGEELKAPRYANAAASCDNHVTIHDIIPNIYKRDFSRRYSIDLYKGVTGLAQLQ